MWLWYGFEHLFEINQSSISLNMDTSRITKFRLHFISISRRHTLNEERKVSGRAGERLCPPPLFSVTFSGVFLSAYICQSTAVSWILFILTPPHCLQFRSVTYPMSLIPGPWCNHSA